MRFSVKLMPDQASAAIAALSEADHTNRAIQHLDKVTQHNARASDQMWIIMEETAAQAEQPQDSSALFGFSRETDKAARRSSPRFVPVTSRRLAQLIRSPKFAQAAMGPTSLRNDRARTSSNGFALGLTTGGGDVRDTEFERT